MRKRIKNITELKKLASKEEGLECYIQLNFGARSSKHIYYNKKTKVFNVINEIDDTEDELTEEDISNEKITNIGKALKLGALITY